MSLWVLLAAFVRVFEDAKIYPNSFFTTSPGIIILFAAIFIPVVLVGIWIEKKKKIELWKTLVVTAIIPTAFHIPYMKYVNISGALIILFLAVSIAGIMAILNKFLKVDVFSYLAFWAHMFDASATFTALTFYGYSEQHVLPTFLINVFGPFAMFALKIVFVIPVVYAINKYSDDEELRRFLLLAVFAIGLAPALRDTLRLLMGV